MEFRRVLCRSNDRDQPGNHFNQGRRQPMSMTDLTSILHLQVLASAAVLLIMAIAIRRNHLLMYLLTLFSLTVAFIALFPAARLIPRIIDPLFIIDIGRASFRERVCQ